MNHKKNPGTGTNEHNPRLFVWKLTGAGLFDFVSCSTFRATHLLPSSLHEQPLWLHAWFDRLAPGRQRALHGTVF